MKESSFINKNMLFIVVFLLLIGLAIELSRSDFILKIQTGKMVEENKSPATSALSPDEVTNFENDQYLLIYDPTEDGSSKLQKNITKIFDYMQKDVDIVTVDNIPSDLTGYKDIIFSFADINKIGDMSRFEIYVKNGGNLFFAIRPELGSSLYQVYRKLGIYELGDHITATGFRLAHDILIKGKGATITDKNFTVNASLFVELEEKATIYLKSTEGTPLLWDVKYGDGKFMVFNGTSLISKENRGLITGALAHLQDNFVYPVMNSKVVYIDDFPSPPPRGNNKEIYAEYKKDIRSFYYDIWWRDMQQAATNYDIKYTGVLIETYNNRVKPPFKDEQGADKENMILYGRELLKMGGEIGIHGYNHQSLTENPNVSEAFGYKPWKTLDDMKSSLKQAKQFLHSTLPNYEPVTYVPPSNALSETGKLAIKETLPSIKILASLYLEDYRNVSYVQEFEKNEDFIELPRITSGSEYDDTTKWNSLNGITSLGIFSHFIHPDDVLDTVRGNNKTWTDLYEGFSEIMNEVDQKYPWLEAKVSQQAASDLEKYLDTKAYIKEDSNKISIYLNDFISPSYFVIRSSNTIGKTKGCTVEKIGVDWYLITITNNKAELNFQ